MHYVKIDPMSIVDGEGCRVSLFVSGCRNHCSGCFNQETWDFNYGEEFGPIAENEFLNACNKSYIAGCTFLGGEPMEPENQLVLLPLMRKFKSIYPEKSIWVFTGYIYEHDLLIGQRKYVPLVTDSMLDMIDILVDGPFIQGKRDLSLKFRGSSNQRLLTKDDRRKLINTI